MEGSHAEQVALQHLVFGCIAPALFARSPAPPPCPRALALALFALSLCLSQPGPQRQQQDGGEEPQKRAKTEASAGEEPSEAPQAAAAAVVMGTEADGAYLAQVGTATVTAPPAAAPVPGATSRVVFARNLSYDLKAQDVVRALPHAARCHGSVRR